MLTINEYFIHIYLCEHLSKSTRQTSQLNPSTPLHLPPTTSPQFHCSECLLGSKYKSSILYHKCPKGKQKSVPVAINSQEFHEFMHQNPGVTPRRIESSKEEEGVMGVKEGINTGREYSSLPEDISLEGRDNSSNQASISDLNTRVTSSGDISMPIASVPVNAQAKTRVDTSGEICEETSGEICDETSGEIRAETSGGPTYVTLASETGDNKQPLSNFVYYEQLGEHNDKRASLAVSNHRIPQCPQDIKVDGGSGAANRLSIETARAMEVCKENLNCSIQVVPPKQPQRFSLNNLTESI